MHNYTARNIIKRHNAWQKDKRLPKINKAKLKEAKLKNMKKLFAIVTDYGRMNQRI